MKLWKYIKEHITNHEDQTISEKNCRLSYADAVAWAEACAGKLKEYKCCAVLCKSEMHCAMALLACFAADVTAIPISLRYGHDHCARIMKAISPDAVIVDDDDDRLKIYSIANSSYITPVPSPALIMCTSGTSGSPKGVMLSEESVIANVMDIATYFDIGNEDAILITRPLYHCAVLTGEFLTSIVKGAQIVFSSEPFNPIYTLDLMESLHITAFCSTPTVLSLMARCMKNRRLPSLRCITVSGECMGKRTGMMLANAFQNCEIYHVYGLTEACPRVSYLPPSLFREIPDCVGKPLPSVSVLCMRSDGTPCDVNEEGVLWIKGPNVMLGYYRDPQKTAEVLHGEWLCTGDIASVNKEGMIWIKGRVDDMIIKGGMNIYPAEIENAMKQDDRVKDVLVYGYVDRFGVQIGMKITGAFSTEDEVRQLCLHLLPSYQMPTDIKLLSNIHRNGSGKIVRKMVKHTK